MSSNFPTALDDSTSLPYPSSTDDTNSPSLAGGQDNQNDAVIAAQTKLGVGSSSQSPTANTVLVGTGTGQSEWTTLSGSQTSGTTGTGNFVLANSPIISSPTISNPTISNPTFSGSLGSVSTGSITATGLITGNGGGTFASSLTLQSGGALSLPTNSVTAPMLAQTAITLGYAPITTNFTTSSTTAVQVTGLTATVTIPSGGRRIRISVFARDMFVGASAIWQVSIWDGTVGSGAQLNSVLANNGGTSGMTIPLMAQAIVSPAAGTKTYNVGALTSANTLTIEAASSYPAFILVEAI